MATIEIHRIGDSDEAALKRNFANLLQRTFNPEPKPMTFTEAIAKRGIDEKHQIHLARRRDRYSLDPRHNDRPKVWPGQDVTSQWRNYSLTTTDIVRYQDDLKNPPSTSAYVRAWCRLNHLKEA